MSSPTPLKVSVLADGRLLLDGQPATLSAVGQAMDAAGKDAVVWYYRENATAEPPLVAKEVMKLVTSHLLPVRLSSLPDFSDSVTPATAGLERLFAPIREKASQRNLVILRPNGQYLLLPVNLKDAVPPEAVATVEQILPSTPARNVAVIGETSWTMAASPSVQSANEAIPFFGLLMGLATIGHAVWVFDSNTAIIGGCRLADVLIVDSESVPALPRGWQAQAKQVMRQAPQILVHDRATYRLRASG
jgi:hypothetical protein